ncbi:Polyubiquitin 12 [Frankliniella fusca]|uniref:Polyubiquitin 12 n=1 Tax=Frankliniella fusca TaxID=407009 RepID=A0AAE1I0Q3_9NEOP|nr:Polyubiquitin 12 [Frankliniella fusca]
MSNQSNNIWKRNKRKAKKDFDELLDVCASTSCDTFLRSSKQLIVDESSSIDKVTPAVSEVEVLNQEQDLCLEEPVQFEQHLCLEDRTIQQDLCLEEPVRCEQHLCLEDRTIQFDEHFLEEEVSDSTSCDQEDKYFNDLGHPFSAKELSDLRTLFDDPEDIPDSRLKADLIVWSLQHKIGRNALTGLLHILRQHNHPNLPLSSKTLLKTPRSTVTMLKSLGAGLFWYYGILVNLVPRLTANFLKNLNGNLIEIDVFVDGVSPYKSVKTVLWPICCSLTGMKDIFIIAMWCGKSKEPCNLSLFLEDFISEANKLMSGFTHLGYNLKLVIRKLIADAPARTWLKNVNQHGSYNACERCTAVGQWIASRMTYHPYEETELRTDQSLRDQIDSRYHKGPTPLTELSNFSLISQMPLEPMHLLCLGVMKRILLQLMGTKRNTCSYKFTDSLKLTIDSLTEYISQFYPSDFARKPRKWTDYALFKATEFRRILLYDGFIILKTEGVSKKVYHNYLFLATAVRILSDPLLVEDFIDDANTLLKKFITHSVSVYGQMFNVYNVHHLKHLADECRRHGDLESFSAFKYENHLGVLKRLLHAPGRTLSQIVCRLMEQVANQQVNEEPVQHTAKVSSPCELPASLSNLGKGFSSIYIPKCKAELTSHSFFLSVDKEIVKLSNIVKTDESYILSGRKFQWKANYFTSPCPSSALDIYEVNDLGVKQLFSVNDVLRKCVVIPIPLDNFRPSSYSEGPCLALPMIHGGD